VMRISALLLLLSACAEQPQWVRMDGRSISSSQLKIEVSYCRDEVAKLETPKGVTGAAIRQAFEADVMRGCMARRGYLQAK
jgi:hypothetical protein